MKNVYDHYYDIITTKKLSKQEMLDILDELSHINSFGSNKHDSLDIYVKMAESDAADDDLIKKLVKLNNWYPLYGAKASYRVYLLFAYFSITLVIITIQSKKFFMIT